MMNSEIAREYFDCKNTLALVILKKDSCNSTISMKINKLSASVILV